MKVMVFIRFYCGEVFWFSFYVVLDIELIIDLSVKGFLENIVLKYDLVSEFFCRYLII